MPSTANRQPAPPPPSELECELRPVRVGLTLALKRGKRAYTTVVTVGGVSTPIAFTKNGWYTQEMVDREIAR